MDVEDSAPKAAAPIKALLAEDLAGLSRDELGERKEQLKAEIARIEAMLESKGQSREAAESVFKT